MNSVSNPAPHMTLPAAERAKHVLCRAATEASRVLYRHCSDHCRWQSRLRHYLHLHSLSSFSRQMASRSSGLPYELPPKSAKSWEPSRSICWRCITCHLESLTGSDDERPKGIRPSPARKFSENIPRPPEHMCSARHCIIGTLTKVVKEI